MASSARDHVADLEKHRLQLEENITKLRRSLETWRDWDCEYETLKEEIESLPEPVAAQDLAKIRTEFQGQALKAKEIEEIFGGHANDTPTKPASQIISLLSRRIDYVTQNIETLEKQLMAAEQKHTSVSVISSPDARDEDGLPITEIIEELDEDGNIINTRLQRPGDSGAQLKEMLEKAGVEDLPQGGPSGSSRIEHVGDELATPSASTPARTPLPSAQGASESSVTQSAAVSKGLPASASNTRNDKPSYQSISLSQLVSEEDEEDDVDEEPARKKGVSFADDTKAGDGFDEDSGEMSRNAQRVQQIMQTAKEQEDIDKQQAVIPEDESEEDAFLRREMLKYGMDEVGAVVAELTLEDGTDAEDDEGFEEIDSDEFDDDDYDEEEDDYGRYTGRMVSDKYHRRMLELEQSLGVKSRFTEQAEREAQEAAGKRGDDSDSESDNNDGLARIVINKEGQKPESSETMQAPLTSSLRSPSDVADAKGKKSVKFAESLDIAPPEDAAPAPVTEAPAVKPPSEPLVEPLSDVVERSGAQRRQDQNKKPKKVSRFRKEQANSDGAIPKGPFDMPVRFMDQDRPVAPSGPKGKTIATSVMEREPTQAIGDDDMNDEFIDQELATEYYRKRRDMIHKHGGLLKEDESADRPLDEADGGRKMSRFKAARLSKQ